LLSANRRISFRKLLHHWSWVNHFFSVFLFDFLEYRLFDTLLLQLILELLLCRNRSVGSTFRASRDDF